MATTSYFQRFARPGGPTSATSQRTGGTTPQNVNPYQSTSRYPATTGMQAPAPYQATPAPSMYPTAQAQPISPKLQQQIASQQARLGAAGQGFAPGQLATEGGASAAQVNAQIQAQQQSEYDRQKAYEEYQRAYGELGQSPEALAAKRAAMAAVQAGGPWTTGLMEQGRGAIRNAGGVAYQGAERNLAEELARRGMGGSSLMGMQQAQLGSQAQLGIQQQLAAFEQAAAQQNEAARQVALSQLSGLAGTEQAQRLGIDEALARLFAETQREPIDYSPFATESKTPKRPL